MSVRGVVRNGVIVLDDPTAFPDGTLVTYRVLKGKKARTKKPAAPPRTRKRSTMNVRTGLRKKRP